MATFYLTLIKAAANRGRNVPDTLPDLYKPHKKFVVHRGGWGGRGDRGTRGQGERKMPIEVNSEQLRFHHMGTDLRKDFNRINNLGLRNLDAEPVKSRSLENSDRKRAAFGKETCKLKSNAAAGQLLSNFK